MAPTSVIKMSSRADEVQDILGYRDEQWHRFYWVTKEEARSLVKDHPEWPNYASFSATEQIKLLERINAKLSADDIPTINAQVLKWRMSGLIREMRRKHIAKQTAPGPQPVKGSSNNRNFDPVRDI